MQKSIWALLVLFPIFLPGQSRLSQEINYTVSKPYEEIDAINKYYYAQGNHMVSIKTGKRVVLQKFDSSKPGFESMEAYEDFPKRFLVEEFLQMDDKLYLIYSTVSRSTDKDELYYREIDFATGRFTGPARLIFALNCEVVGQPADNPAASIFPGTHNSRYIITTSFDKSKILIQYRQEPRKSSAAKNFDVIGLHVFNSRFNKIWGEDVVMPYTEKKMNNLDYGVDGIGNVYILTTVYNDNTTRQKDDETGKANYHIELLRVVANTRTVLSTPIRLNDKFVNKIWMYERPNNQMICAGFYNDGKYSSNVNGIFMFNADQEGRISNIKSYEIPLEVLNQYASRREKKKNAKDEEKGRAEFEDLLLRELYVEKDGSFVLIGEQSYVVVNTYYNGRTYTTTRTYWNNDMLLTRIDSTGSLAWMRKLPKRQAGNTPRGGMSYKYMKDTVTGDHFLVFLDDEENLLLPAMEEPSVYRDGSEALLTAYRVSNHDGKVTKHGLVNTGNVKGKKIYQFSTSRILQVENSVFVFEAYKKEKEDILVRVNLKK